MSLADDDGILSEIETEEKQAIDRLNNVVRELERLVVQFNGQQYESTEFGELCKEIDSDLENDIRELRVATTRLESCMRNPRRESPGRPLALIVGYNARASLFIVQDVEESLLTDIEKADYSDLEKSEQIEQHLAEIEKLIEQENLEEILEDIIEKSKTVMVESEEMGAKEFDEKVESLARKQIETAVGFSG